MQLNIQSPFKALNKAYLKEKISRSNIEIFKQQLIQLFDKANEGCSEDTLKDFITELLRNTWYNPNHLITINKERKDLSVHTGKLAKDPVAIIAEIKKSGSLEMMSADKPNVKAFHELVLYYLQERVTIGNNEIKYLLATDVNNWVLIDANEFDKKIFRNVRIKKLYEVYINDLKDNPFFYAELKRILDETDETIICTHFNLKDFKKFITNADKADDNKLINLYKILSPAHLLKLSFANDSNSLDKNFYTELLHLVGLEEVKDGSKKLIQRKKESSEASLLENAIIKLQDKDCLRDVTDVTRFGFTNEEQYYNIALELCITWINRILFLKLLEAQLYTYHQNDKGHLFLNDNFIHDFDELNNLFLQVLAEKPANRRERLKTKFSKVPYLNSSLFERTELERRTIDISALDNNIPLPIHPATVLKDDKGKRRQGALATLHYLFTFLDSYDFTSEGKAEIQEENKTLINASVLGLIFEKINGYKDGSFFTPGFITMYMCRETLRRAVVQRFNETNNWQCAGFDDLQQAIDYTDKEKRQQANNVINSLTICDVAVGSGHFLVSALNELISIKQDLKVLQYRHNSQRVREYSIEIVNDELILADVETEELFEYKLNQKGNIKPELQAMQETLFHEKETLIENCLFGVDINANSVKICRLRLWIELLKNAYYTNDSNYAELETLPNIDINIKQGNSLISRFDLDADLGKTLEKSKWTIESYKAAVQTYRNAESKEEKRQMEELIDTIKKDFKTDVATYDPINKKLSKLRGELALLQRTDLFSPDIKKKAKANKELEKLSAEIDKLDKEKEATQSNVIYKDAFEWRFEFPEVLDGEGKFLGFDAVIGNPPYVRQEEISEMKNYLNERYKVFNSIADLFTYFIELGHNILKQNGKFSFIVSNKFTQANYGKRLREFIKLNFKIYEYLDFSGVAVFDSATVDAAILNASKSNFESDHELLYSNIKREVLDSSIKNFLVEQGTTFLQSKINDNRWVFENSMLGEFKEKIIQQGERLKDWPININYGIKTGLNEAFFIDEITKQKLIQSNSKNANIIKALVRGRDISSYYTPLENQYLLFIPWHFPLQNDKTIEGASKIAEHAFKQEYPDIYGHLFQFKDKLEKRNKAETGIRYEWYALQRCANTYFEEIGKSKIVYPNMTKYWPFSFDEKGAFINDKIFIITGDVNLLKYLLALLNSSMFKFVFKDYFPELLGGTRELRKVFMETVPLKRINSSIQVQFITLVDKILTAKKENPKADTSAWEKEIDEMVYSLYELTPEEIQLVAGIG